MGVAVSARSHSARNPRMGSILDLTLSEVLWLAGFNVLLFELPIQNFTGFSYIDEFMAVCLLGVAVKDSIKREKETSKLNAAVYAAMFLLVIVVCLGLLGNITWEVQTQAAPILIDIFTCIKFPLTVISGSMVFSKSSDIFFGVIEMEAKVVVAVLFVLGVANLFVDYGMGADLRYGLRSFMAVFGHPTYLVFACVGLSVILLANWKHNLSWIIVALVVISLSLRSKGLVYAAIVVALLVLFSRRNKISILQVVVCAFLAFFIAYDQFVAYFQTNGFARTELLQTAFEVANDHAPYGSGFATYGSAVTADLQYYSSLYYEYGLSTVWGLSPDWPAFLSDTFWPTVLGQFGWMGVLCYAGVVGLLFRFAYQFASGTRLAACCCFLYLLISSTSESAFFNPQSVYLAVCLSIVLGSGLRANQKERFRKCNR